MNALGIFTNNVNMIFERIKHILRSNFWYIGHSPLGVGIQLETFLRMTFFLIPKVNQFITYMKINSLHIYVIYFLNKMQTLP